MLKRIRENLRGVLVSLSSVCAAVLLLSCFGMGLPPGFTKNGAPPHASFPVGTSDEAVYSVLSWYLTVHGGEMKPSLRESVTASRDEAASAIFHRWSKALTERMAPLVRLTNDGIELVPTVFSQNMEITQGLLIVGELETFFAAPYEISIPREEAMSPAIWRRTSGKVRDAFMAWAAENPKLEVPDPSGFDRKAFVEQLRMLDAVLRRKQRVSDEVTAYEEKSEWDEESLRAALDSFTRLRESLPKDISFEMIGDKDTIPKFNGILARLPYDCLSDALSVREKILSEERGRLAKIEKTYDAAATSVLSSVEADISTTLRRIREDDRYSSAVTRTSERLNRLVADCADMRSKAWCGQLIALRDLHEYRDATELFKTFWKQLDEQSSKDFELYHTLAFRGPVSESYAAIIKNDMTKVYLELLPLAYDDGLAQAEKATNVLNKHGICAALCMMLIQMSTPPQGVILPDALTELRRRADALLEKSTGLVYENNLKRTVFIGDMSSATPGIGLTYSRDLENELRIVLDSFGLSRFVTIPESGSTPSQWGYVTYGGMVANFDGQESVERQTTRTIRRNSQCRRMANPEYKPDAAPPVSEANASPQLYLQDVLMQVIHVREIERLAHVRVFMNFRGPGFTKLVEVNEFYKKKFSFEESHPFNDIKLMETKKYYDAMSVPKEDPEPVLLYDRVWTPGEMLDWARRDSLRLAALLLLYHINDYPLYLAQKGERLAADGDAAEATETWSHCQLLCQSLDTDSDLTTLLKAMDPPAAKGYEACVAKLRKQRADIAELKRNATVKMFAHANAYLRKNRITP